MAILKLESAVQISRDRFADISGYCHLPQIGWTCGKIVSGKRIFDLVIVVATLPIWLPTLAAVLAVVKISDWRHPPIFRQTRRGYCGRAFSVLKVRTMVPDAEKLLHGMMQHNEASGPHFKMRNDPRITRIGKFLRRTHLDELPQLLNVLRGDMSLVGPRPGAAPLDVYLPWWKSRLLAIPGVTCIWQIDRKLDDSFADRARQDIRYLRKRSLRTDLVLLLRTIMKSVVARSGT